MASPFQPREVTPIWDRPGHPYADQFGHEWAWHFEDDLQAMATAADGPEDFHRRITAQADRLGDRHLAANWRAFVNRKLAGVDDPELAQDVEVTPPAGVRQPSGPTPTVAPHARGVAGPPAPGGPAQPDQPPRPFMRDPLDPGVEGVPAPGRHLRVQSSPGTEVWIDVGPTPAAPSGPDPEGWVVAQEVSTGRGRPVEVVYSPRRHAVMVTNEVGPETASALEANGWERHGANDGRALWVRDKVAATQTALARLDRAAAGIDRPGPDRELGPIDRGALALEC